MSDTAEQVVRSSASTARRRRSPVPEPERRTRRYPGRHKPVHIVSVSGGKDSTACYLLALERREKRPDFDFRAVFADVGNEHPYTYDYIMELPEKTGGPPIEVVRAKFTEEQFRQKRKTIREEWPKEGVNSAQIATALMVCRPSGNPFIDLCVLVGGFPSVKNQYCTHRLKVDVIEDQIYNPIWEQGGRIVVWQGLRSGESKKRAEYGPISSMATPGRAVRYLPLLDWSVNDVRRIAYRHGIELNQLYSYGFERVGCFPCIHAKKKEMAIMGRLFWQWIERKAAWERHVSFAARKPNVTFCRPMHRKGEAYDQNTRKTPESHGIIARAHWARPFGETTDHPCTGNGEAAADAARVPGLGSVRMSADIIPFPGPKQPPQDGPFTDFAHALVGELAKAFTGEKPNPGSVLDALLGAMDEPVPSVPTVASVVSFSRTKPPVDSSFGMFRSAADARAARQRTRDWQMAGLIHAIAQRLAFGDDELYRINIPQLSNRLDALAHLSALDSAPREPDPDPFLATVMNSVVHFIAERLAWGEPTDTDTEPGRVMTVAELGDHLATLADRCHKDIQLRGKDNDQTEERQD